MEKNVIESTAQIVNISQPKSRGGNNGATVRGRGTGKGKGKKFQSADDLIAAQLDYLDYITSINYQEYPTKIGMAKFSSCDVKTIYNCLHRYFPEIGNIWKENTEQCLVNGVNAGVYHPSFTIFVLKNWCGWAERQENISKEIPKIASREELTEALENYLTSSDE